MIKNSCWNKNWLKICAKLTFKTVIQFKVKVLKMFSQYFFAFKRQVIRQSFYISKFKIYTLKKAINSFSFKSFGTKCFKQLKTKKKLKFYYFKNYFSVKFFNKTTRKLNLILYFLNGCIYLKKKKLVKSWQEIE